MSIAISICAAVGMLLSAVTARLLFARLRTLPAAPAAAGAPPRISVIIPARNEEQNLTTLLPSLASQSLPAHQIIVVDDRSDDGTADLARRCGATVVPGQPLEEGWFGKPWACQQGAQAATGDWLLFLDADLSLEPDALARLAALTCESGAVFSVCPHHRVRRPYEQLSVFFNLLMIAGINAFTWKGDQARGIGLFGQVMLVSRDHYDQAGGHRTVRRKVLENFHLAREFDRLGIARRCFIGRGSISMRMFPGGLRDLVAGWMKGFASGAGLTPPSALVLSSLWLSGLMTIIACLCLLPLGDLATLTVVLAAHLAVAGRLARLFRQAGSFSFLNALLFPLSLLFYQVVFARALVSKLTGAPMKWKGRDVSESS